MNFKRYHVSKNLFDKSKKTDNSSVVYTTGEINALNGVFVSDFTLIEPNTTYTLNIVSSISSKTGHLFALYDENKNFVNTGTHEATSATVYTFATPSNVAYIRFNGNMTSVDSTMLNYGSEPLPYEPYGDTWLDSHYIHNTSTDTITTLPAVLYPNDTTATVGLKGQTVQSGTPTPDNPIQPEGCGERTGNLLSEKYENRSINGSGAFVVDNNYDLWVGEVVAGQIYTISNMNSVYGFFTAKPLPNTGVTYDDSRGIEISGTAVVTVPSGCTWIAVRVLHNADNAMLNLGSTALPYEPYGYKITFSSAGQTNNIYLGEVQTTRKIKKLVLTGEEAWSSYSGVVYLSNVIDYLKTDGIITLCTHYQPQSSVEGVSETTAGHISFSKGTNYRLCIRDSNYTSATTFKTYLQQQYAAGTPVCVWYVLATEETGIVNEPLMRIGDYADSLTTSIPVTAGPNSFDVDTTVAPSEVTAGFEGWHPVQSVHERENGQWD